MAKRGKGDRKDDEWIQSVTSDQSDFYPWKQWKYHPQSPGKRKKSRKISGDRGTGMISLVFGLILLLLTLIGSIQMFRNGDSGTALAALIFIGGGISFVFLQAAHDHFRYSAD